MPTALPQPLSRATSCPEKKTTDSSVLGHRGRDSRKGRTGSVPGQVGWPWASRVGLVGQDGQPAAPLAYDVRPLAGPVITWHPGSVPDTGVRK
ncbi:unnamed protein product [Calypogeia fissa]